MAVELEILVEGDVPGVREKRVSLRHFGPAFRELEAAVRSVGSSIIVNALGDPDYGVRGGRRAAEANALDLELATIEDGSLKMVFVCALAAISSQLNMLPLAEQTVEEIVHAIDAEAQGRPRNAKVRKFLGAMPAGLTSQTFICRVDGVERNRASLGAFQPKAFAATLPSLFSWSGKVSGVGFDPATRNEVWLKTADDGTNVRCVATPELVNAALSLRGKDVDALTVYDGKTYRLLWLRAVGTGLPESDADARAKDLFERWGGVLRRLA